MFLECIVDLEGLRLFLTLGYGHLIDTFFKYSEMLDFYYFIISLDL